MAVKQGVPVFTGVGVEVAQVPVGVSVEVGLPVKVKVEVGLLVKVRVEVGVGVSVGLAGVGELVKVLVQVAVQAGDPVHVAVKAGVSVSDGVRVAIGVWVAVFAGPAGLEGVFFLVEQAVATKAKPNAKAEKVIQIFLVPMFPPV